jgi:hypothetical protein
MTRKKQKAVPLSEQTPRGSTTQPHCPKPRRKNAWMNNFFLRKVPPIWAVLQKDR